jgi:hypothetical protein
MISKIAPFLFLTGLSVSAQTNFDVLVCNNASYTNATIIRATPGYVVVDFNGGIAKVALTNLPANLQGQYHYDPDKAAAALAADEKHRLEVMNAKAEQAKYRASLRGTNQVIQVDAVLDSFGKCQTSAGQIYLAGLPSSVSSYLERYAQLKALVAENQMQVDNKTQAANTAIGGGGSPVAVWEAMKQSLKGKGKQTTEKIHESDEAAGNLSDLKASLADMESGLVQNTTIIACPTGMSYSGLPMWQFVVTR